MQLFLDFFVASMFTPSSIKFRNRFNIIMSEASIKAIFPLEEAAIYSFSVYSTDTQLIIIDVIKYLIPLVLVEKQKNYY